MGHDDGEDDVINVDVSSQSNRYRNTSNDNHHSSASSECDENADDENELSEGDNDLSGLANVSLQRKIASEVKSFVYLFIFVLDAKYFLTQRPQWKNHSVESAPVDLFDDNSNYQDGSDLPKIGYEGGTTASEFDGALDEQPEDDDEDNVEVPINVDELDEGSKPKHQKRSKKVCISRFNILSFIVHT